MDLSYLIPSRTVGLALSVVPLLASSFSLNKADDWVYEKLPAKFKKNSTLAEFEAVIASGKAFLKSCYDFFHK